MRRRLAGWATRLVQGDHRPGPDIRVRERQRGRPSRWQPGVELAALFVAYAAATATLVGLLGLGWRWAALAAVLSVAVLGARLAWLGVRR